jgi:hypothetical protein
MIIGFIGAGVMARALGKGLVDAGVVSAKELICSAPTPEEGRPFQDLLPGSRWTPDNCDVLRAGDLTILAVKPQVLCEALVELKDISAGKLILSIAAGVTLDKLRGWLHPTARVVRCMPNMLVQIGAGATAYTGAPNVTDADLALVERVLAASGKAWRVEESQLDAVTALSGSGPAYVRLRFPFYRGARARRRRPWPAGRPGPEPRAANRTRLGATRGPIGPRADGARRSGEKSPRHDVGRLRGAGRKRCAQRSHRALHGRGPETRGGTRPR